MPLFGAHFSIAGGVRHAAATAEALGCGTFQLFTKTASQWAAKPLPPDDVAAFRETVERAGLKFPTAHDSYLINLASADPDLWEKSVAALAEEVHRADLLGLSYLVSHPGAHLGAGEDAGLARVVAGLDAVHARCPTAAVRILIETTAGQGTTLGWKFEHLAAILAAVRDPARLGVCFDTCHVFAAGYPLGTTAGYAATTAEFDRVVGLDRIRAFHVNDSAKPLGSRVDRHAGLGLGHIGEDAFRLLVTDPRFADRPMILETPKEDADGGDMDPVNLAKLRSFAG